MREDLLRKAIIQEAIHGKDGESLPEGWRWVKTGEVVTTLRGVSYKKWDVHTDSRENDCLILRGGNIHEGTIDIAEADNVYIDKSLVPDRKLLRKNDIIVVASTASTKVIGRAGVSLEDYNNVAPGAFLLLLRPVGEVFAPYVAYYFQTTTYRNRVRDCARGGGIKNLRVSDITEASFPLPPLDEQRRIVAHLDPLIHETEELARHIQAFRRAQDRFRKAVIQEATHTKDGEALPEGWRWVKLSEIVILNPRNHLPDNLLVSFIPMERLEGGFSGSYSPDVRKWGEVRTNFTHFKDGDIIVAKITPCFQNRKSAILSGLTNGYGAGTTELHVLRAKECVLNKYIYYLVKSEYFIFMGANNMQGTAGQKRIRTPFVRNILVPLPPLDEQRKIVQHLEDILSEVDAMTI